MKNEYKRYFLQNWKIFDAFNLPKNFVVDGDLDLSDMGLDELPNMSTVKVKGRFDCSHNNLVSLIGAPRTAKHFDCSYNKLKNLVGAPSVTQVFDCSHNNLKSLNHSPDFVDIFNCSGNQLLSL